MEAQTPADGIMNLGQYSHGKMFKVACDCGSDGHSHTIAVEPDEHDVTVTLYTTQTTKFWEPTFIKERYDIENYTLQRVYWALTSFVNGLWHRLKQTWQLWVKGHVEFEASIILHEQQAVNYATALLNAVAECQTKKRKETP